MGRIRIGTSSWADKSLIESGQFYPSHIKKPVERLRYYADTFTVTEIDSTFYAYPRASNLKTWIENTPSDFAFNIKPFRLFTHHPTPRRSLPKSVRFKYDDQITKKFFLYIHDLSQEVVDELWMVFMESIAVVGEVGKLGVIFFQFPPWFHFSPESFEYLGKCSEMVKPYRMAVEFRTHSWFDEGNGEETMDFLRDHGIALICVDGPQGFKSSVPPIAAVTAPTGVIRLHGRNAENWERKGIPATEKYRYLYSMEELEEWTLKIRLMAETSEVVHVIFKNKYQDYSVRNALQMRDMLQI